MPKYILLGYMDPYWKIWELIASGGLHTCAVEQLPVWGLFKESATTPPPFNRALMPLTEGIWGILEGSWGV